MIERLHERGPACYREHWIDQDPEETAMAKGQMRSNKEVRKPKADKKKAPVTATVPGKFAAKSDEKKK
jgi:hypothetical protein